MSDSPIVDANGQPLEPSSSSAPLVAVVEHVRGPIKVTKSSEIPVSDRGPVRDVYEIEHIGKRFVYIFGKHPCYHRVRIVTNTVPLQFRCCKCADGLPPDLE